MAAVPTHKEPKRTAAKPVPPANLSTIKNRTHKLAIWTRQLQVLLDSSVNLAESLNVLQRQNVDDMAFAEVLKVVSMSVERGSSFSQALSMFPRVFPNVMVGLVYAGESTGKLGDVLKKLADMFERDSKLMQRMKSAFTYPAFVLFVTAVLTFYVFYAILPSFIEIFRDQHIPLPLITRVLIFVTDGIRNPGLWLLTLGLGVIAYVSIRRTASTREGALRLYNMAASIPAVGITLKLAGLARFCWVMECVIGAGIDLLKCTDLASKASGSPILEHHNQYLREAVQAGLGLGSYLSTAPQVYTSLMGQMVNMAEESGGFEGIFTSLADSFNQELETRLELLNSTIEPALMTFVAFIVGTIVVGIFLPLYSLVGNLGT